LCAGGQSTHRFAGHIGSIGGQSFGVSLAIAVDHEEFLFDATTYMGGAKREDAFDSSLEIARHPIGAAHEEDRLRIGILETAQSTVFEEATEEAPDTDVVALAGDAGLEAPSGRERTT